MRRQHHSKSSLFLMELLINLLLFCFLCGCGLMFFIKSHNLSQDATALHNAVRITSSVAGIYETGDGTLASISEAFEYATIEEDTLYLYLDKDYNPCAKASSTCHITVRPMESSTAAKEPEAAGTLNKIRIDFYNMDGKVDYSIQACNYSPYTLSTAKEVVAP